MIEAVVQAAGWETPFRRVGDGSHVVVLEGRETDGVVAGLVDLLAPHCRLFILRYPDDWSRGAEPAGEAWLGWLRGVIDGLGLASPALLVHARLAAHALRFAIADPGRVGRVAILFDGDDPLHADPGYHDRLRGAGHPLLLVGAPASTPGRPEHESVLRLLVEFLDTSSRSVSSTGARPVLSSGDAHPTA